MDAAFWNERYKGDAYVYGTEANTFLVGHAHLLPPGPVLCLAEGEGRNATFLALRGHEITAVDQSEVALGKARNLARRNGVEIQTIVADLATFEIEASKWAAIVAIWAHLPTSLRREVHARCVRGLRPGGVFLLEAYTPGQLKFDTGGPRNIDALMTLKALRQELDGLEFLIGREIEREVHEGVGHGGRSAVVQVAARKPLVDR